jgi:hypothetical protein
MTPHRATPFGLTMFGTERLPRTFARSGPLIGAAPNARVHTSVHRTEPHDEQSRRLPANTTEVNQ